MEKETALRLLKKYRRPLFVLAWMAIIFTGSSIPGDEMPSDLPPDYLMHFLEYSVLGALSFWWASRELYPGKVRASVVFSTLLCSIYAVLDEFHQFFVPGRCMDPRDWAADSLGGLAGAVILTLLFTALEG